MNSPVPAPSRAPGAPSVGALYAAFWRHARGKRLHILYSSLLLIGSQLIKLCIPWLAAQAINTIQTSGVEHLAGAGFYMLLIILTVGASWAMHGPGRVIERNVAVRVRQDVADRLYARLSNLPLAWHEKNHSGDTLFRVEKTTNALYSFAQNQFIYLQSAVNLAGPIVALTLLSRSTGIMALVGYVVIALVIIRFDRILMRLVQQENDAQRRYNAAMVDCLGNIATVLSLRLQNATRRMLDTRLAAVFAPLRRSIVVNEGKWCAVDLLSITLSWLLVALYAWSAKNAAGTLLLGDVFMVYQYTQQAAGVVGSIAVNFQSFARMYTDYSCADDIWRAETAAPSTAAITPDWRRIDIDGLRFSYGRRKDDERTLEGLSLTLRRGERIAFVGASGSGKSTLMRLLGGLYRAHEGVFRIDGVEHPELRHLGSVATLIPQDAEVFEGSVRDNITFGADYSAASVEHAIRLAGFDAVIDALPQGLDTVISERGLNLSGGQRQRLALARGFLAASGSTVLMLDEPTSSLDALTESRIFEGLKTAMPDACIIAAVHRLNLLPRFDRTVLMHNGHIVDTGTVEELRARQPLFEELWQRSTSAHALAVAA